MSELLADWTKAMSKQKSLKQELLHWMQSQYDFSPHECELDDILNKHLKSLKETKPRIGIKWPNETEREATPKGEVGLDGLFEKIKDFKVKDLWKEWFKNLIFANIPKEPAKEATINEYFKKVIDIIKE